MTTKLSPLDSARQPWIKGEYVIYWGVIWSVMSAILYLTFSIVEPGTDRAQWFKISTIGFEEIGLLIAGGLCWRNYRSKYIPSGRIVWLLYALAMLAFLIGNFWFALWESLWGLDPAASVGNPFFVLFYLLLIAGVRLAILERDIQLGRQQWFTVLGIATFGLIVGCWLTTISAKAELPAVTPIVSRQSGREQPHLVATAAPILTEPVAIGSPKHQPKWVLAIDRVMQPLVSTFNLFYVLCDLVLLIFAAILLLGFWGGQLGLPWRMTAQAVLCFYIADTWFAYAHNQVQGYESGSIMEVFWIFGIVQFGIAAALEFDNSIRPRRLDLRRTAIK
jgi:hypothetical protein